MKAILKNIPENLEAAHAGFRDNSALLVVVLLAWLSLPLLGAARAGGPGENKPRVDAHGDPLPAGALTRLGSERLSNRGQIGGLAFSPNGKWLASEDGSGNVHLWDVPTGKEIRILKAPVAGWGPLAFSPNGKVLASSAGGDLVCLWQPDSGRLLRRLAGPAQMIRSIAFAPDNQTVAAGGGDGSIFLWDVPTGKQRKVLKGHRDAPNGLAFAPDGKTLVSTGHDGTTRFWDVAEGKERARVAPDPFDSSAVLFASQGKTVITAGGQYGTIRYWDVATRQRVQQFPAHKGGAFCLALSADGKILASGGSDRTVRFWNAATTAELGHLPEQPGQVNHLALSPDGTLVAWGTFYGSRIRLGQVTGLPHKFQFKDLLPRQGHEAGIGFLACTADGKKILSTSHDAILWDERSGQELHRFPKGSCAALSPDGKLAALADVNDNLERMIHVFDTTSGKEVRRFPGPAQVFALAFCRHNRALICADSNGKVHLLELATGKARMCLEGQAPYVHKVLLAPDGLTLASASHQDIRIWDIISGKEISRLPLPMINKALAFSGDGKILACGVFKDSAIVLWDVSQGKEIRRLRGRVHDLVFTPDGQTLAAACMDDTIRLWDVATGKQRHQFSGHAGWIMSLAISPDGRTLVSGSTDTTILMWTMDAFLQGKPLLAPRLTARDLSRRCAALPPGEWPHWWADLALPGGEKAHRAIWGLVSEPRESLPVIRRWVGELCPMPIDKLLADLDHDEFARREAASQQLERLGDLAVPALRRALAGKLEIEPRRRIERILARREVGPASGVDEGLRMLRVLEVLELVASAEARAILTLLVERASDRRTRSGSQGRSGAPGNSAVGAACRPKRRRVDHSRATARCSSSACRSWRVLRKSCGQWGDTSPEHSDGAVVALPSLALRACVPSLAAALAENQLEE